MKNGLCVVIEGIDGSGKTTQALELVSHINKIERSRGFYAKSPNGCPLGEKIMALTSAPGTLPGVEMAAFLFSNTFFYKEIVAPKILCGKIVVLDRWTGSFLNYFNLLLGFCHDSLNELNMIFMDGFLADKTFLLDITTELAVKRMKERGNLSKYDKINIESVEFMEKQRNGFLELAQKYNWIVIDGSNPVLRVKNDIISLMPPYN